MNPLCVEAYALRAGRAEILDLALKPREVEPHTGARRRAARMLPPQLRRQSSLALRQGGDQIPLNEAIDFALRNADRASDLAASNLACASPHAESHDLHSEPCGRFLESEQSCDFVHLIEDSASESQMPFTNPKKRKPLGPISDTLSRIAKARGLSVRAANKVVGFYPGTGRFEFAADEEELARWIHREQTEWLLEFIQCAPEELPLKDPERHWRSIDAFVHEQAFYAKEKTLKPSHKEVAHFRNDLARAVRKFLLNRKPLTGWIVQPDRGFKRRLVWVGDPPTPFLNFVGGDWRTRFKLHAQELLRMRL